jgi:glycosyltransferase involved in cell wall biosynthesis
MTSILSLSPVSAIIPAYNAAAFIGEALLSVLRQTVTPLEILVVDDGSVDETARIVRSFGPTVTYVYQEHNGASAARNHGLRLIQGERVTFLDADDCWTEDKLALQMAILDCDPEADLVIGHSQLLNAETPPWLFLNLGSALFRRNVFKVVGEFDPALPYSDDLDWFLRAREVGLKFIVHREVVLHHRRHTTNMTNDHARRDHFNLLALKRSLERRRATDLGVLTNFGAFARGKEN